MLCPKCNYELKIYDCYDTETWNYFYTKRVVGDCPVCGKVFQWEINYRFLNEGSLMECN